MQKKSSPHIYNRIPITKILPTTKTLQKILTFFVVGLMCLAVTGIYGILSFSTDKIFRFSSKNPNSICLSSIFVIIGFGLIFAVINFSGCSHNAVNRGHIISLEYNRPPWIGCPPDTGCDTERTCKLGHSKSSCDCDENSQTASGVAGKKIRRHCGLSPNCTVKNPCCETPGCGMWVDPSDPNSFAFNSRAARACGLTPFCSPMRPCGMTPYCGRPFAPHPANQPAIMSPYGFNPPYGSSPYAGLNPFPLNGALTNGFALPSLNFPTLPGTSSSSVPNSPTPNSQPIPSTISSPPNNNGTPSKQKPPKPTTVAGPNGILVSMGIVPGVSAINGGGYVAAAGVVTPNGMMTPNGIQLPNGTINNQLVIRACGSHPGCTPSHPCGMTPGCGMPVSVALVSNNAAPLAAELIARSNRSNGVVPAVDGNIYNGYANYNRNNNYGNVMLANGTVMQNLQNGANYQYQQNNYPNGQRTNYVAGNNTANRNAANNPAIAANNTATGLRNPPPLQPDLYNSDQPEDEYANNENEINNENDNLNNETAVTNQGKKSMMPLPRFHSVPTEPAFNRRKGISVQKISNENGSNKVSKYSTDTNSDDTTVERAYLKGVIAALNEVEAEIDSQTDEIENAKMKSLAMEKANKLQAKIDAKMERNTEIAEFETEQQRQLRELAIQAEQIKFEQQRQARILAKRQTELDQESHNLTVERNRLQQEQFAMKKSKTDNQQMISSNNSNIQLANYQQVTKKENKNIFASAVNFLKGNSQNFDSGLGQNKPSPNLNPKNKKQKPVANIVAKNNIQQKINTKQTQNSNQSTGAISQILSPITNLIGSNSKPSPAPNPTQKNKTKKISDDEEITEINLPSRPETFPDKPKRNSNIQYVK
ncbi:MAG: hypothetical protein LBC74_03310 [Planctomycetaceae bacterium]|jgi:hypothetical protein|nr:hypothetical protein [Planctomycetaceae bacterium]